MFLLALSMTACGGGEAASVIEEAISPDKNETASQEDEEDFTETPGRTTQGPATIDVGAFTVDVPEGWLGIHDLN